MLIYQGFLNKQLPSPPIRTSQRSETSARKHFRFGHSVSKEAKPLILKIHQAYHSSQPTLQLLVDNTQQRHPHGENPRWQGRKNPGAVNRALCV
jgi:hypothetical protein